MFPPKDWSSMYRMPPKNPNGRILLVSLRTMRKKRFLAIDQIAMFRLFGRDLWSPKIIEQTGFESS
jgi:hypothetical protein